MLYNYSTFRHDIFIKHHIFHEFVRSQKAIMGQTLRGGQKERSENLFRQSTKSGSQEMLLARELDSIGFTVGFLSH